MRLDRIADWVDGHLADPTLLLGPRQVAQYGSRSWAIRAYLPTARQAWVVDRDGRWRRPMRRLHPAGLFEAICPGEPLRDAAAGNPVAVNFAAANGANESAGSGLRRAGDGPPRYVLELVTAHGVVEKMHDPYAFPSLLDELDRHLLGEGRHWRSYDKLGAQVTSREGVFGTNFSIWAPNARRVALIGDFNDWDGRRHPLCQRIPSGIWELFLPGVGPGARYKFRITGCDGETIDRADPNGFAAEMPPHTASIVADLNSYPWQDHDWLTRRSQRDPRQQPLAIYEVHLGSWRCQPDRLHGWMNYRELAHQLVDYCRELGFTHVELLPVSEHPFTGSWGYQTVGYYAVTSRYGSPEDFMYFVDYCHQHNLGVILDWVPAHFPRDEHGLRRLDGTALYEHDDPRRGEHPDWGTLIFNYGRNEVRNYLISNALFWLDKYHIDGLRVDAVASMLYLDYSRKEGEWVPNEHGGRENLQAISFLQEFNREAHGQFPGVLTIAEESTAWGGVSHPTHSGGLGFSFKWNMGWMNDTLAYMRLDPIHRQFHHDQLTFSLIYAYSENFLLPLSHDEVVHGKRSLLDQMPGDAWQKFANLRLLFAYMWTHPGKKLIFMGGELAQWAEWSHEHSLPWSLLGQDAHRGVQQLVQDLNQLHQREPALHHWDHEAPGFEWIDCSNRQESTLSYLRRGPGDDDLLVIACNFTPIPRANFVIGVPREGYYQEILNTDSAFYGGSNLGNHPGIPAAAKPAQGRPFQLNITLPPLATVIWKRSPG